MVEGRSKEGEAKVEGNLGLRESLRKKEKYGRKKKRDGRKRW
jgi:hypothetical protein